MTDWSRPLPREVPAYHEAAARGLVPRPSATVPVPDVAPGPVQRTLVAVAAFFGVVVAFLLLGETLPRPVLPVAALVALVVLYRLYTGIGTGAAAELQRGYTTMPLDFGWFGLGRARLFGTLSWDRAPWDYSGTWVLEPGRPPQPPDPRLDPPGYYPSPTREGSFELWTGRVWSGHFRQVPPGGPPAQG